MIRLMIWGVIFAAGLWAGNEYAQTTQIDRCLNAGGAIDANGLCLGLPGNG
ncbi:MAG: hypothetical protein OIF40_11090 [Mangrovicoccus sp.]|nr:hypothetical protein [Mangrovicoccus sp.]